MEDPLKARPRPGIESLSDLIFGRVDAGGVPVTDLSLRRFMRLAAVQVTRAKR